VQIGLIAATLVLVALAAWWLGRGSSDQATTDTTERTSSGARERSPAQADTPSVAVLPFSDLSPEKDQEYFTDGLTEELINALTHLDQLRVAGRTSSFQFRDRAEDLQTIGEMLNVSTILEGSVRKVGNLVRVSAQLVNTEDGINLWSETYDRTLEDIFEVQDDIARSVASALEVTLLGGQQIVSREVDPEAFNLLLRARHFLLQSTNEATEAAMDLLNQALQIDPDYAAAWADLGLAYIRQGEQAQTSTEARQGFQKGIEMAQKALELDPSLAVAMTRIAGMRMRLDFDFRGAERETDKAVELAPNDPRVLGNASIVKGSLGNMEESLALLDKATKLDPLHQTLLLNLGIRYFQAGRLEDAEAAYRRLLQLNPDYLGAHALLGNVYLWQQRPKAALEEFGLEKDPIPRAAGFAMAQGALGDESASQSTIDELKATFGDDAAVDLARVYAFRGEPDPAFEWLDRAVENKNWDLVDLKPDPAYDSIRSDPRWQPLLARIGFVD
jgi:TolB-like protein/Flp pilus assembly protein TadD